MVPAHAPRAYTRVLVFRLPLTTLMFEFEKTVPCTRKVEPVGCWMFRPSSPAIRPSARIALPGRLHWLRDGHWMSTFLGSAVQLTAAESEPAKLFSASVSVPPKQCWPAAPLYVLLRMLLMAACSAPSAL